MERVDITQLELLAEIAAHLRSYHQLADNRVILTVDPLRVRIPKNPSWWLSVSPGSGTFPQDMLTGGVVEQCTEDTTFKVTGYMRLHLDQEDHDDQLLLEAAAGLMELKKKILRAMCGLDMYVNSKICLRELISPQSSDAPTAMSVSNSDDRNDGMQIGVVAVTYGLVFDWDLS